jgi:hypothetical protein
MLLSPLLVLCSPGLCQTRGDSAFVTVPRIAHPPAIDGRLDPDEWRDAAAISGWVSIGAQALAEPSTVAYLGFDSEALYLAFRCLEPDRRLPRAFKRPHDDRAFEDDCVQVFVAPEDPRAAKTASISFGGYDGALDTWYQDIQAYYEFTVSAAGSETEARNDVRDWDAPWQAAAARDEEGWTAEIAIPFAAFGLKGAPADAVWGLNLFRNRPPQLSGWVCPAFGGYRPLPLGAMRLVADRPFVQQAEPPRVGLGDNELRFAVRNPGATATPIDIVVSLPGGEEAARRLSVAAGATERVIVPYRLLGAGGLRAAYAVRADADDVPLLAGSVPLYVPPPVRLDLRYFALPAEVRADVHLSDVGAAAEATLTLQPPTGAPAVARADLRKGRGDTLTLPVKGEPGDRFSTRAVVTDSEEKTLAERSVEFTVAARPAWLGTQAGLPLGVLPPWKPMQVSDTTIEMLGKRLTYGDFALPASIVSAGGELLAGPIRPVVRAGGGEVRWQSRRLRIRERTDDHAVVESVWTSPKLTLSVTSTVEYDGFCWNEITLAPTASALVERVALEIPMRKAACRYVYEGHAQAGHALSPLGLRRPIGANLWLGDEERGIAWLAESLEWVHAQDRARQVEILPGGGQTLWRSTFIDTPTALSEPYTAQFALHITPAKPVSLRKSRIYHGAFYGMESAPGGGSLSLSAAGRLDPDRGTFECWVKPTFDTGEAYDANVDRSHYNRQFLQVRTNTDEMLILYYNADDRNLRCVTRKPDGSYPVVLSAPGKLPAGQWSYVGLAWGDKLRLNVNGQARELDLRGTVTGSVNEGGLRFDLGCFALDEIRTSRVARPLDGAPESSFTADADTLLLDHCDTLGEGLSGDGAVLVEGRFGKAIGAVEETFIERLARQGKRIVVFHENWSRFQGYPDLAQVPKLKRIADACHQHGMLFLVYFNQSMSTAAPEWEGFKSDLLALPESNHYHRDDVPQDCYTGCVNGPYGELLLDGIAKLADEAGIDGVYMDGTTVPWNCSNPTHPGCGTPLGDGTYLAHQPIRATREFMKRLRNIFAQRRSEFFLDAHTGGCINIATQSFTDGYYDGEQLARYKPGFRLSPDTYVASYMGKPFGVRGEFLPNRHTMDQALAISLIHDSATRGQPPEVDRALAPYEDPDTRFIGYWEHSPLYAVAPPQVLGSLYAKPDRALLVLGSQTEEEVGAEVRVGELLEALPKGATPRDAISGEALDVQHGRLQLTMPGRGWRLVELRR